MPDVTLDDPTIQCDDVERLILMMTGPAPMMVMSLVMMMMFKGGRGVIFTSVAMTRLHLMPSDVVSSFCHTIVHTATSLHTVTGLVENFYTLHAPHGTRYCQL